MRNTLLFLFVFAILFGCKPQPGSVFGDPLGGEEPGGGRVDFKVSALDVTQAQMTILGDSLDNASVVKITGPNNFVKNFSIKSKTNWEIISTAIDSISLPMGVALNLIIANANGQSSFPITFTLQPDAVGTSNIQDNAVSNSKLQDGSATRLKINKEPTDSPNDGQVLKWNDASSTFVFADDAGAGAGGTGTVTNVNLGSGIVGAGTSETVTANIVVDTDTTGDGSLTKIPFFTSDNQLVLDSSAGAPLTRLTFAESTNSFSITNDGALRFKNESTGIDLLTLESDGKFLVGNQTVCFSDGTNCSGSTISGITPTYPLEGGGTTGDIPLWIDIGTGAGQMIQLDSFGALPSVDGSNLTGVVTNITAGTAINTSEVNGDVTVNVTMGSSGNAQQYRVNLDNLGTIPILTNGVVIGNISGTAFESQAGDTFKTSVNLLPGVDIMAYSDDLQDIASLLPLNGTFIGGDGSNWQNKIIPNCITGQVVTGDGDDFLCTDTLNQIFYGGTYQSNNQGGFVLMPDSDSNAPGEIQFVDPSNNLNKVSLRAPAGATITSYTLGLPPVLGTDGDVLKLDNSGNLFFQTPNYSERYSSFTPETNELYFVDSTSEAITVTLPPSPNIGDKINFFFNSVANGITLEGNGNTINDVATVNILVEGAVGQFIYNGTQWVGKQFGEEQFIQTIGSGGAVFSVRGQAPIIVPFTNLGEASGVGSFNFKRIDASGGVVNISFRDSNPIPREGEYWDFMVDDTSNDINFSGGTYNINGQTSLTIPSGASRGFIRFVFNGTEWTQVYSIEKSVKEPTTPGQAGQILVSDGSSNVDYEWNSRITRSNSSSVSLESDSSGNIGVGTSTPSSKLHVLGVGNARVRFEGTGGATAVQSAIEVKRNDITRGVGNFLLNSDNSTLWYYGVGYNGGVTSNSFIIDTDNNINDGSLFTLSQSGNLGVGTNNPNSSSILDLRSTTSGFLPPRMTTTQRDAITTPATGLMIYNTTS